MGWTDISDFVVDDPWCFQDANEIKDNIEYLSGVSGETQVTLADNQSSAANIYTFTKATYRAIMVEYTIERGTNFECGSIIIVHDGTNAFIATGLIAESSSFGCGVTLSADVSGADCRLRYTTTSTGTAGKFNFSVRFKPVAT